MALPGRVLATAALVPVTDRLARRSRSRWVTGVLDETAHLATGQLVVWAAPGRATPETAAGVIAGSVGLDADHVPDALWGVRRLRPGDGRPSPHSLSTVAVLAAGARVARRSSPSLGAGLTGAAVGVGMHLIRDLAVPPGVGVPLLWPVSARSYETSSRAWRGTLVALTALAWRGVSRRTPRPASAR